MAKNNNLVEFLKSADELACEALHERAWQTWQAEKRGLHSLTAIYRRWADLLAGRDLAQCEQEHEYVEA